MSLFNLSALPLLAVLGLLFVILMAFQIYWAVSNELTWASRIRQLLEPEGFSVQHLERRWLTRGPFPDMRPPGVKYTKEWLVRVVATGRDGQPRAGWVRWHRRLPWEPADRWAVRWDELPWSGHLDGAPLKRKRGVSTLAFMALPLIGMVLGVVTLFNMFWNVGSERENRSEALAREQNAGSSAATTGSSAVPDVYEIRCRGGEGIGIEQLAAGSRTEPGGQVRVVLMTLEFLASPLAAGVDAGGLGPGACAWIDRPLNDLEPRRIRFETAAVRTTGPPHDIFPAPDSFAAARCLRDPTCYWTFFVFNTNQGFLEATSHMRWIPSQPKGGSS